MPPGSSRSRPGASSLAERDLPPPITCGGIALNSTSDRVSRWGDFMGELVAWGLGLGLGYAASSTLTTRWRILIFAFAVLLLGALITLLSGEMFDEPWLVLVDIGRGAGGALIGALAVPFLLRRLQGFGRSEAR